MARHKRIEALEEDEPGLDISSLIDCVFLLLIYFLVTTTIQPREQDLTMNLPAVANKDQQPLIEPKLIVIDSSGSIFVGAGNSQIALDSDVTDHNVPLLSADLRAYAAAAKSAGTEPVVQIDVDGAAAQQRVIDVLNALAGVEIYKATFTDRLDP